MRPTYTALLLFTIFLITVVAGFILFRQTPAQPTKSNKLQITATIFPLYDIAKNIGRDKVDVTLILPPGASPHTFDLKPSDIQKIQKADLVFSIGHELDGWITQALTFGSKDKNVVVDKDIVMQKIQGKDDPHYWLSIKNAKQIALNIGESLINADSINGDYYLKKTSEYLVELAKLEQELTLLNLQIPDGNKNLITFHDAWYYFAEDWGFNIAASFEPFPGKSPSPGDLTEFAQIVKNTGTKVIYSEPQIPSDLLESLAKDLGVKIAILDPIGGVDGRDSFIKMMRYNMEEIVKNK